MSRKMLVTISHWSNKLPGTYLKELIVQGAYTAKHVDMHVDMVFDRLPSADKTIKSKVSRFIVDLNRARDDFSKRGVILKTNFDAMEVIKEPLTQERIKERLEKYYDPFHNSIKAFISKNKPLFLLDGHSMDPIGPADTDDAGKERPELMLGTNDFTTSPKEFVMEAKRFLEQAGYEVKIDDPYGRGGYIHKVYADPPEVNSLELEINKMMYLNMSTLTPNMKKIKKLRTAINEMAVKMKDFGL